MLSLYPIIVKNASLFNCKPVCRASDSMSVPSSSYSFQLVGAGAFSSVAWPTWVHLVQYVVNVMRIHCVLPQYLIFRII